MTHPNHRLPPDGFTHSAFCVADLITGVLSEGCITLAGLGSFVYY